MSDKKAPVMSLDQLLQQANPPSELELEDGSPNELVFEGGELDGLKTTQKEFAQKTGGEIPAEARSNETVQVLEGKEKSDQTTPSAKNAAAEAEAEAGAEEGQEGATSTETAADGEEGKEAKPDASAEPAYQPTLKYKVYDEEKDFPDWAKPLATSKETEENLRVSLQKSEAFDHLKPKHETVVRERDQARVLVDEHLARVQRLVKLSQTDPDGFLEECGLSDEVIINIAVAKAKAAKDPEFAAAYKQQRDTARELRQRDLEVTTREVSVGQVSQETHRQLVDQVFSAPAVAELRARMEAAQPGSFETAVNLSAGLIRQSGHQGYIHPADVAKKVMDQYGALYTPKSPAAPAAPAPATTTQVAPAQTASQGGTPAPKHVRPKTLANVGRGSNISPTAQRPRTLDDVKKRAQAEMF